MKRADGAAPAVDEDGHVECLALAGPQGLSGRCRAGRSSRLGRGYRFGAFVAPVQRKFGLDAMRGAFEREGSSENLFERIEMAGKNNPILKIAVRAANVDMVGSGSAGNHAFLMLRAAAAAT